MSWLGVSTGALTVARLEHDLHESRAPLDAALVACTHLLDARRPHLGASLRLGNVSLGELRAFVGECLERGFSAVLIGRSLTREVGLPEGRLWARAAIEMGRSRKEGRAIRFRGHASLTETCSVSEILERSEIERVEDGYRELGPESVIVSSGFVRPVFAKGALVLQVTPLGDGRFQPSETPRSHRCCAAA